MPLAMAQKAPCRVQRFQVRPTRMAKLTGAAATCCRVRNRLVRAALGMMTAGIRVR